MEQTLSSISPMELYGRLGTATAPTVVDVRRPADFATAGELIISAYHRDPDKVEQWGKELPRGRQVVVHCVHGHQVSQGVATALRAALRMKLVETMIDPLVEFGRVLRNARDAVAPRVMRHA